MKQVYKLALLAGATTCLVGVAQADFGPNSGPIGNLGNPNLVHFTDVEQIGTIGCAADIDAYYEIKNSGPTSVNLVFKLDHVDSDVVFFEDISCSSDVVYGDIEATGKLASGDYCEIIVEVNPLDCPSPSALKTASPLDFFSNFDIESFNGILEIDINTRQVEISAPIVFETSLLGAAEGYAVLSGGNVNNFITSPTSGSAAVINGNLGLFGTIGGFRPIYVRGYTDIDNSYVTNALADATAAYAMLSAIPCQSMAFPGTGPFNPITPAFYCPTNSPTSPFQYYIYGTENDIVVFNYNHTANTPITIGPNTTFNFDGGIGAENVFWLFNSHQPVTLQNEDRFDGTIISSGSDIVSATSVFPTQVTGRLITTTLNNIDLTGNQIDLP